MAWLITAKDAKISSHGDLLHIRLVEPSEPTPEPEPPVEDLGCDPRVKDGTFPLDGYSPPEPSGPMVTLEEFGGQPGQDSTAALRQALDTIKNGGVLRLQGMYGLSGSNRFKLRDASILGGGWETGFFTWPRQPWLGEWRALMELDAPKNVHFDNFQMDGQAQKIGHIRHFNDENLWFTRLHCHDIGGSRDGTREIPLAAIKGSNSSKGLHAIGLYIHKGWGDGRTTSGVRGIWSAQDKEGASGMLWEHLYVEDMGHTGVVPSGGRGPKSLVRCVTSVANRGAGIKTEAPEDLRDDRGWLTWFPDDYVVAIRNCILSHNVFHGVQFEGAGTDIEGCLIEDNAAFGCASFDRNYRNRFVNNVFKGAKDGGIWFSSHDDRPLGATVCERNTFSGSLNRGAMAFHDRCTSPREALIFTGNKVPNGKKTVVPTPQVASHSGYREEGNGPNAPGADGP